ncbi:MAG: SPFH/Band 7/PHB domain protein [candidate division Zixibacteria bacterium]|nr:SPFH/Band 7/PHB domain protein [candidate division Zixibacteria bacterium]
MEAYIFVAVVVVFAFIIGGMSIRIIRPYEKGLVERLGRYQRTLDSGLNLIMPFFDTVMKVDMREIVLDVPPQMVITKDNVNVEVDCIVYCQITDPVRAKYEISNYILASSKLAQTNLRNVIGEMELDQSLSSRDVINAQLRDVLDTATDKWGVKVNRVEIQRIDPPVDITEAMSRQMKAERDKRAAILEAEGQRQAAITVAEGSKRSAILEAEGQAEAVIKKADAEKYRQIAVAEGQAKAILDVFSAIHEGKPNEELITLKYLEMLPKLAEGDANKLFLPYEASGIISSLAAMVEGIKSGPGKARGTAPTPQA